MISFLIGISHLYYQFYSYLSIKRAVPSSISVKLLQLQSAIKNIPNATGGGHKDATGAKISSSYLSQFKDKIEELVNKK